MDRKRKKLTQGKKDVQKECQEAEITALKQNLMDMEAKLMRVIAELEQVKEERARDKIDFGTENCELKFEIDKYKVQCTELQREIKNFQSENEKLQSDIEKLQSENKKLQSENKKLQSENENLQKYLQGLESANITVEEEKSQIHLCNTDLNSHINKVNETNDDPCYIIALPSEIILKVFSYLTQNQLGQIARVCRQWNVLTKSPPLWKNAIVDFSPLPRSRTTVAKSFVNGLPSCVTSIRIDFMKYSRWTESLGFHELCLKLQEKCPDLDELTLIHSILSNSFSSVISLCSQFLQNVKKLSFQDCLLQGDCSTGECFGISNIKILELLGCHLDCFNSSAFSKLPHLEQLHLFRSRVPDSLFEDDTSFLNQLQVLNVGYALLHSRILSTIQNHGHNLKELYLCNHNLQDRDLFFTDSTFPHLKTICFYLNLVTCEGVVSLIQSCPSLENVYVNEHVAESFATHPFVVANRCKLEIVKVFSSYHNHNVNYLHY